MIFANSWISTGQIILRNGSPRLSLLQSAFRQCNTVDSLSERGNFMRNVRPTYPCTVPAMLHESLVRVINKAQKLLSQVEVPIEQPS